MSETYDLDKLIKTLNDRTSVNADLNKEEIYIHSINKRGDLYYLGQINTDKYKEFNAVLHSITTNEEERFKVEAVSSFLYRDVDLNNAITQLYEGNALLLMEDTPYYYLFNLKEEMKRALEDSSSEKIVRGPKLAFIENLSFNVSLIRQLNFDTNIQVEEFVIQKKTKTKRLQYVYQKEKTDPKIIKELKKKLQDINTSNFEDSGMIEGFLEERRFSPFPQVQNTERVDRAVAALDEGRVVILVEGSPFALIIPTTFDILLQSPDDYYERWIAGSFIRLLRYIAIIFTLFLSSIYISLVSFHPGLLPDELALTIMNTRMEIPFPPIIEALIMEATIEFLREAGIRLPTPLGQTIGLVGGVIIGQAAVEAHIVSSVMVIIISLTAIASFCVPQYNFGLSFRLLRFGTIILAGLFGLFGVICFLILITIHLASLQNFGVHYFSLKLSLRNHEWRDLIIRFPKSFIMKKDQSSEKG
ncbi:hypothetical protein BTS2_0175 [Bacillus sp. TS-2]|nr:hypothetical protein BTS2_0175 [Bacillus sp. TS-2]